MTAHTPEPLPTWFGSNLDPVVRDVATGRISAHPNVTSAMVREWLELHQERREG